MTKHDQSLIELNFAVLLWGGTALFSKLIALPAFQITGLRSPVAALALLLVMGFHRESIGLKSGRDLLFIVVGGLALGGHWVTYFQSMQVSTVAVGILALHTYPVMTALLEPLLFRERFHAIDLGLALVVLVGVGILVPTLSLESSTTRGVLWGVSSALLFSVRNLLSRVLVRRYSGRKVMGYQLLVATVVLLPAAVWFGQPVDGRNALKLILLGVLFTALPHTLFTNSLRGLKAKTVAVIATMLPVYGTCTAALFLGEIPGKRILVGGCIIVGAVLFESWRVLQRGSPPSCPTDETHPDRG